MDLKEKYLKYKTKYLDLKAELLRGGLGENEDKIIINLEIIEKSPLYNSIIHFLENYNEFLIYELAGGAKQKKTKGITMTLKNFHAQPPEHKEITQITQITQITRKDIENIFGTILDTEYFKEKKNNILQFSDEEKLDQYLGDKYGAIINKIKDKILQENIDISKLSEDNISEIFYSAKEIIEIIEIQEIQDDILEYVREKLIEYEEAELKEYKLENEQDIEYLKIKYDNIYKNILEYIKSINNVDELPKNESEMDDFITQKIKNYDNPLKYQENQDFEDPDLVKIQEEDQKKLREEKEKSEAIIRQEQEADIKLKQQKYTTTIQEIEAKQKEELKTKQEEAKKIEEEVDRLRQEQIKASMAESFHLTHWGQQGREAEEKYLPILKSRNFKICILEIKYDKENKFNKTDEFNKKLKNLENKLKCLNYRFSKLKKIKKSISNIDLNLSLRFDILDDLNIIQKFTFDDLFMQYISQIKDALCQYLFGKNTNLYKIDDKYYFSFDLEKNIYISKNNEFDLIYNIKLTNLINKINEKTYKELLDNINKLKEKSQNQEIKNKITNALNLTYEKKKSTENIKLLDNFILSK